MKKYLETMAFIAFLAISAIPAQAALKPAFPPMYDASGVYMQNYLLEQIQEIFQYGKLVVKTPEGNDTTVYLNCDFTEFKQRIVTAYNLQKNAQDYGQDYDDLTVENFDLLIPYLHLREAPDWMYPLGLNTDKVFVPIYQENGEKGRPKKFGELTIYVDPYEMAEDLDKDKHYPPIDLGPATCLNPLDVSTPVSPSTSNESDGITANKDTEYSKSNGENGDAIAHSEATVTVETAGEQSAPSATTINNYYASSGQSYSSPSCGYAGPAPLCDPGYGTSFWGISASISLGSGWNIGYGGYNNYGGGYGGYGYPTNNWGHYGGSYGGYQGGGYSQSSSVYNDYSDHSVNYYDYSDNSYNDNSYHDNSTHNWSYNNQNYQVWTTTTTNTTNTTTTTTGNPPPPHTGWFGNNTGWFGNNGCTWNNGNNGNPGGWPTYHPPGYEGWGKKVANNTTTTPINQNSYLRKGSTPNQTSNVAGKVNSWTSNNNFEGQEKKSSVIKTSWNTSVERQKNSSTFQAKGSKSPMGNGFYKSGSTAGQNSWIHAKPNGNANTGNSNGRNELADNFQQKQKVNANKWNSVPDTHKAQPQANNNKSAWGTNKYVSTLEKLRAGGNVKKNQSINNNSFVAKPNAVATPSPWIKANNNMNNSVNRNNVHSNYSPANNSWGNQRSTVANKQPQGRPSGNNNRGGSMGGGKWKRN